MRKQFQPMSFISPTYSYTTPQEPDTLSVSGGLPVVIPQKDQVLKLNIEKPVIKTFDFEANDSMPERFREVVTKPALPVPSQEVIAVDSPKRTPDIDGYQHHGYRDVYPFPGLLYPVLPGDSVSALTYANYYGNEQAEREYREPETSVVASSPVDSAEVLVPGSSEDSVTHSKKGVKWFESIVDARGMHKPAPPFKPLVQQEWFLAIVIIAVAITGILRLKWRKYLGGVFNSVLFSGVASSLRADKSDTPRAASFWLGFMFYLNSSLFIFEILFVDNRTLIGFTGWKLLVLIFSFLVLLFSAKLLVYKFIGWVFDTREEVSAHLFQSSLMSKAYSMVLLPVIVLFPFANDILRPWLVGTGVGVFILLYIIQIGRGIGNNLRDTVSGYYIILYLCALEILPLSILFKVLFY